VSQAQVIDQLNDWRWRLNNLYQIIDKSGKAVTFKMNWGQEILFNEMHNLDIILKARQIGFSTFIQIFMLDICMFNPNISAGTIAHKLDAAKGIFKTKIKYPYDHLPDGLKAANPATVDSERVLEFKNGSVLNVDTSFRGGTFQYLHISEFGKICAKDPERAEEIVTGAFNTVQAGNMIFVESTAEGRSGRFYEMCRRAQAHQGPLTTMDWKFFFFPWWKSPEYRLDAKVPIPQHMQEYFIELDKQDIHLDDAQKAWYVKKEADQGDKMKREYPSTPKEAFEQAIEGAYFSKQLNTCRQRKQITKVPHDPAHPVHTFWDLGKGDATSIWFYQHIGMQHRFFDYYENSGEDPPHYYKILQERGKHNGGQPYNYGKHHMPHDADSERLGAKSVATQFRSLGMRDIRVGVRVQEKESAIEAARTVIPTCWFDEENCVTKSGEHQVGLPSLENYQKQWNPKLGTWRDEPIHNWASHGADAFMEFAMNQQSATKTESRPLKYRTGQYA
jgi:hypothetical protein